MLVRPCMFTCTHTLFIHAPVTQTQVKALLELMGVPYVVAPGEAEAQCAVLESLGLVHGIVTDDSDVFLFGGKKVAQVYNNHNYNSHTHNHPLQYHPCYLAWIHYTHIHAHIHTHTKVYKNIFDASRFVECYSSKHLRAELGLTRELCVGLAMLLGSDYTDGINGVGIVNACEVLTAFCVRPSQQNVTKPTPGTPGSDCQPYREVLQGLQEFASWMAAPAVDGEGNDEICDTDPSLKLFKRKHRNQRSRWLRHAAGNFPSEEVMNAYFSPIVDNSTGALPTAIFVEAVPEPWSR